MGKRINERVAELDKRIKELAERSVSSDISSTERARIAVELRSLLTERTGVINHLDPNYPTTQSDSVIPMNTIVRQKVIKFAQSILFGPK